MDLVKSISTVFNEARGHSQAEANEEMLGAYWEIGRRIFEVEQNSQGRAAYGSRLLERLSEDLNGIYSRGFSVQNLRKMRAFHLEYQIRQPAVELSWTHYMVLLSVKDRDVRDNLEKLAIEQKWSRRRLTEEIKKFIKDKDNKDLRILSEPVGRLFVYKIIRPVKSLEPVIDLGFGVRHGPDVGGPINYSAGTFINSEKLKTKYRLNPIEAPRARKERFAYVAYLTNVVDGDTIVVDVDLGFNVFVEQRLRLRGIDAPEINSPEGIEAKIFLEERLKRSRKIVIKTYGNDKYGRRLADVLHLHGEEDPKKILEKGYFLNQELLDVGLVDPLD